MLNKIQPKLLVFKYGASYSNLMLSQAYEFGKVVQMLREMTKVQRENFQFTKAFKDGNWDGFVHVVKQGGQVPTGLIPYLRDKLTTLGYGISILDRPAEEPIALDKISEIYPVTDEKWRFQETAINSLIEGGLRGILKSPTGSGKTVMASKLIGALAKHRVLFLVDSIDLMYQSQEAISKAIGEKVGIIGDGEKDTLDSRVVIGSVQSLGETRDEKDSKKVLRPNWDKNPKMPVDWLKGVTALIVDECHLASGHQFYDVVQGFTKANIRIGLSATPFDRTDENNMRLMACCGPILYEISSRELIDIGVLAEPRIKYIHYEMPTMKDTYKLNSKLPWQKAYEQFIVSNIERNLAIVGTVCDLDKVLILIQAKKHGNLLYDLLTEVIGDCVFYVSGDDNSSIRTDICKRFKKGEIKILIASRIFDKGIDLPQIENLVLAGGGKSHVNLIQRIGRGMRTCEGKEGINIYDFVDEQCKYMKEHYNKRRQEILYEGYEVNDTSIIESNPDMLAF